MKNEKQKISYLIIQHVDTKGKNIIQKLKTLIKKYFLLKEWKRNKEINFLPEITNPGAQAKAISNYIKLFLIWKSAKNAKKSFFNA